MKKTSVLFFIALMIGFTGMVEAKPKWVSLFNGKDLKGWVARGKANWYVKNGTLVGEGGMGHIYTDAACTDFEARGTSGLPNKVQKPTADSTSGLILPKTSQRAFRADMKLRSAIPPMPTPDGYGNRVNLRARRLSC